jgi:RNA-directed DNA polymerase
MAENDIYINHGLNSDSSTGADDLKVHKVTTAFKIPHDLAEDLIGKVVHTTNLKSAFRAVKRNKGAPGIDKRTISEVEASLDDVIKELQSSIIDGKYTPSSVRGVQIPKTNGKTRLLGIPTVIDRMVQQAIVQILSPIFDPHFSDSSYGFRPKRSASGAISKAKSYVKSGKSWVVDMDIEAFFDNVNHDILMSMIARSISDKKLLKLIRSFLNAGMMQNGLVSKRDVGTPQGGPLSPLLSNVLLHELDRELHLRNHSFVRYADDCNIYVSSKLAAQRVLASITKFLSKKLKLTANLTKSAASSVQNRKFLGFTLLTDGSATIAKSSISRFKDKVRLITKRNRGVKFDTVIRELNQASRGWFHYFKVADSPKPMKHLDGWMRRRLRSYRLKQRKRKYSIKTFLVANGVSQRSSWSLACSRSGWWRKSLSHASHQALDLSYFEKLNLFSMCSAFAKHKS